MMRRIVVLATASVLRIGLFLSGCGGAGDQVITFADPNLETALRATLHKPSGPIYASELAGLTSLDARWKDIENLSGLQYCTNLLELNPGDNRIGDVSALANLTKPTDLKLDHNQTSDISALADLTNLTSLSLSHNQISDISPLADLTSPISLSLLHNRISDISPLVDITNLTNLELDRNPIMDISPLVDNAGLPNYVSLEENPLSSASINIYLPELRARDVTVYY